MKRAKKINIQRKRRARRIRMAIRGSSARPRLSLFRSTTRLYAQIIDDQTRTTLVSSQAKKGIKLAEQLGKKISALAKKANITEVVFDRGEYKYHGNVKTFAEAARAAGLKF